MVPLILSAVFLFFITTFFLSEAIGKVMLFKREDQVLMTMTTAANSAAIILGMLIEFPHLMTLKVILERQSHNGR